MSTNPYESEETILVDRYKSEMVDLSDVFKANYARYCEILGPLDVTDAQYE